MLVTKYISLFLKGYGGKKGFEVVLRSLSYECNQSPAFISFSGMVLGASDHLSYIKRAGSALYQNDTPLKLKSRKYSTLLYTERAQEVIRYHAGASKV